jgi:hypothetical protein
MLQADDAKPPRQRKSTMDYRLELVPIPVSDVDRGYANSSGEFPFYETTRLGGGTALVEARRPTACNELDGSRTGANGISKHVR